MIQKCTLSLVIIFFMLLSSKAQVSDSTKTITDSSAKIVPTEKSPKQKEVKKIDDPLLALSGEFIYNLKRMKPNQLLVIDQRSVRNEKRVDEYGEEYEVTVTVRLSFSQDMITGIVKEVPLYQSNSKETNIIYVKIPVKFCCTTPIDTLHTKKHCGKMSELNDFEEKEHCKDWAQQEDALAGGGGSGKSGSGKTTKGGGVTGKASVGGEEGDFGKPIPKGKKDSKKGKNKKGKDEVEEEEANADSTQPAKKVEPINTKDKKGKSEKVEKKNDNNQEGFGKPAPKSKKKGKGEVEKEEPAAKEEIKTNDASEQSVDSTTQPVKEPIKTTNKKEKKKKG